MTTQPKSEQLTLARGVRGETWFEARGLRPGIVTASDLEHGLAESERVGVSQVGRVGENACGIMLALQVGGDRDVWTTLGVSRAGG